MNRSVWNSIVTFALLAASHVASAEDQKGNTVWDGFSGFFEPDWERDFSATVGVKVWMNEWRRDSFFGRDVFINTPEGRINIEVTSSRPAAQTSDLEATPIPQVNFRYKWLFASGSYYAKTTFEFEPSVRNFEIDFPDGHTERLFATDTTSAERYEWDATGGIYVHPNVAIVGGYKKIKQDIDFITVTSGGISNPTFRTSSEITVEGPIIGIAGAVPMGKGFGLYASYAHGFMDVDAQDVGDVDRVTGARNLGDEASYDVGELGFTYSYGLQHLPHMPLSAATVYAGYRFQAFETDAPAANEDRSDTTRGFVAGLNLVF